MYNQKRAIKYIIIFLCVSLAVKHLTSTEQKLEDIIKVGTVAAIVYAILDLYASR
jgi:hypothetical protein